MPDYKVLWKMKGLDTYFSVLTRPGQRLTEMRGGDGVVFHRLHYGGRDEITEKRLDKQLRRFTEVDPESFYMAARLRGAEGGIGEIDLTMPEETAHELENFYRGSIKLVSLSFQKPSKAEPAASVKEEEIPAQEVA